jgi:hypothetical protein
VPPAIDIAASLRSVGAGSLLGRTGLAVDRSSRRPSSSLRHDLSRVRRIKAKPLRGRFASLDPSATARGMAATRRTGEEQGDKTRPRSRAARRAISGPLTPVIRGRSRSLTAMPRPRSAGAAGRTAQIPKLIVRVRFPSPALMRVLAARHTAGRARGAGLAGMRLCDQMQALMLGEVLDVEGGEREPVRLAARRDPGVVGRPRSSRRLAVAEILPHAREAASSEFRTAIRPSQRSSSSRVRGPQLRMVAHCYSSPTVTNVTHSVAPVSLVASGSPSWRLIIRDATSVSRTT